LIRVSGDALLFSGIAIGLGIKPIRLARSTQTARASEALLPGAPVIVTAGADWKGQVRAVLAGRPLYAAVDSVGGSFINEIASLLEPGGFIVSFGWLGDGAPDLSSFAPNRLSLRGATVGSWRDNTSEEQRAEDLQTALELAQKSPELFEVAAEYPLAELRAAVAHVERPGKSGTVLLNS
jgi:NADPH:quinone reductase-like Zn-dependent oxidoreductase